jgi:hypothetical protein
MEYTRLGVFLLILFCPCKREQKTIFKTAKRLTKGCAKSVWDFVKQVSNT